MNMTEPAVNSFFITVLFEADNASGKSVALFFLFFKKKRGVDAAIKKIFSCVELTLNGLAHVEYKLGTDAQLCTFGANVVV